MKRLLTAVLTAFFFLSFLLPAAAEELPLHTVEVPGTDRSLVSPLPPAGIVPFELEKDVRVSVRPIRSPFSLGPFSVWARAAAGDDDAWCAALVTGVATGSVVGDLRGNYLSRSGPRTGETEESGDFSLLVDYRFKSGVRLRLSSSYLVGRYDLLGPLGVPDPELSHRSDEGQSFDLRLGYMLGNGAELLAGVFYDDYESERSTHSASERRTGITVLLSDDEKTLSLKLWKRDFSGGGGGEDDVFASLEVRDDYLIRAGAFSVGVIFGLHLAGESRVVATPQLTAGWLVNPRFRLSGVVGLISRVPSLDEDVLSSPRTDPWESPPSVATSFLASVSAHIAFLDRLSATASMAWRSASDKIYAEAGPEGYMLLHGMDDADFFSVSLSLEANPVSFARFIASVEWTYSDVGPPYRHFPYVPEWKGAAKVVLTPTDKLSLSFGADFRGYSWTSASSDDRIAGFTLLGCEISYNMESYLRFFLRAENIGDKDYLLREGWPGYGSSFLAGVEVRF